MEAMKDRVAIVTGASRGIGLGIAAELVRQGAKVCVTARGADALAAAVAELGGPDVAIAWGAHAKQPGERMAGREVELFVDQKGTDEMEPYERLIGDALSGDAMLFAREDEVEAAWAAVDPVPTTATTLSVMSVL